MSTTAKLQELGIDLKGKVTGQIATQCPQCSGDRKKSKMPCLTVWIDEGNYHCNHCGWKGKVFLKEEKVYNIPEVNNSGLNDADLKWLADVRGLSKATVMRFGLYSGSIAGNIAFPFYDPAGGIVNLKYRAANKKFYFPTKGAKMILFGMHLEHNKKSIIVTEGEIDAMSFYEAGRAAVSVPNGAMSFPWMENCAEWLDSFEEVIIAFDSDAKGIEGREELARRIGRHKCKIFQYPDKLKDANELLVQAKQSSNWKAIFQEYFKYIVPFPVEGIIQPAELRERMFELREKGFPIGERTGFRNLDDLITWPAGQLTVVTGIPNHGKSEMVDAIIVALRQMQWLIYSPENMPYEYHLSKITGKIMGNDFFKLNKEEIGRAMDHAEEYFSFADLNQVKSIDDIIEKTRELVRAKGIKGVLIDPYSRLEHNYMGKKTETEYVREILDKLSLLARQYGVHVILVAHPTKMAKVKGEQVYEVPNLYSISGSAHFYNTADNGLTVYRRPQDDDPVTGMRRGDITEIHVQKIRFRWVGEIGMARFNYNVETGMYSENNTQE